MRMRGFLVACLVGVSVVMAALALSCSVALAGVVPAVEDEWALNVSSTGVELHASIDPNGLQTTYHFELGAGDCASTHCESIPTSDAPAGSENTAVSVVQQSQDLTPNTTYHFRVVASGGGVTVDGPDRTFSTFPPGGDTLPDRRVYEMVSPVDKEGGQIDGGVDGDSPAPEQAAEDGEAITYASQTAFAGAEGGLEAEQYLARRGPEGWVTQAITPPQAQEGSGGGEFNGGNIVVGSDSLSLYKYFSANLSFGLLVAGNPQPVAGAPVGYFNPYLRETATRDYRLLSSATPAVRPPGIGSVCCAAGLYIGFAGASTDGTHVVFGADDALTPDAVPDSYNLYESFDGRVHLVSVLPNGTPDPGEAKRNRNTYNLSFGSTGDSFHSAFGVNLDHVVSADGSRIFWTGSDGQLYMREGGVRTVQISASQKTNGSGPGGTDPAGTQEAHYWAASADGSKVFFTSCEQLTNEATAGPGEPGCTDREDLYAYDTNTGELSDLTVDHNAGDVNGAEVVGVLGASEDGSYVYFAATGQLAPGAAPETSRQPNIYVWHAGTITFIATLAGEQAEASGWSQTLIERSSRVSPNGRYLAFQSKRSLTGYDNSGFYEVYEYDAMTNSLACASCNPSGARPTGDSFTPAILNPTGAFGIGPETRTGWQTPTRQQRYLLDDGRLFFDSVDALSPRDTNGNVDVYEYEDSHVYLISSGGGESLPDAIKEPTPGYNSSQEVVLPTSSFVEASASGNDVFFVTTDRLVPQDVDGALDLYDARVDGGFPKLSPPVCAGTGCQGVPPAAPIFATPASVTFDGVGNFAPAPVSAVRKAAVSHKPKAGSGKQRKRSKRKRSNSKRHAARKHG